MGRYTEPTCRVCRREGTKLFLKGNRCTSEKCAIDKRSYKPGMHGQQKTKLSDYGTQLREKQKAKAIYGLLEKQFRNCFKKAENTKGITGEILLQLLERRLDNVVFRCSFASSRQQARQLVTHGLIKINDRKMDKPSYTVKIGDVVSLKMKEDGIKRIQQIRESYKDRPIPGWIILDDKLLTARIDKLPKKEDVGFPIQEQLIVELYSK